MVTVKNLIKYYGSIAAVNNASFLLCKGQITAMIGPNGAGKSTVLGILSTAISYDSGNVIIDGYELKNNMRKTRKIIGVVFQNSVLDERLTVAENLRVRGNLYGLRGDHLEESICETIKITGIDEIIDRYYGELSGGQKRRCDIARALLHRPKLLLLDEPTAGLDPNIRKVIWNTLEDIKKKTHTTILMSTHYMDEAEKAEKIIIMKAGKAVYYGNPDMMKKSKNIWKAGIDDRFYH